MNFKGLLAVAAVATAMPMAASALSFTPNAFPTVISPPPAGSTPPLITQTVTVESGDIGAGAGFFDLIFDVSETLELFIDFTFNPFNAGVSDASFAGLQMFFIEDPDTSSFTPLTSGPIGPGETSIGGSVELSDAAGNDVIQGVTSNILVPNPGTIVAPAGQAGENYALRFVFDDVIQGGNLVIDVDVPAAEAAVVPLPAGLVLLLTGLAGLGFVSHRRKGATA